MDIPYDVVRLELIREYRRWRDAEYEADDRDMISIGAIGAIANLVSRFCEMETQQAKEEAEARSRHAAHEASAQGQGARPIPPALPRST